jgi:hypothetical protein
LDLVRLYRPTAAGVGVVLLTGTAIVPPPGFIVRAGDGAFIGSVRPKRAAHRRGGAGLARLEEGD